MCVGQDDLPLSPGWMRRLSGRKARVRRRIEKTKIRWARLLGAFFLVLSLAVSGFGGGNNEIGSWGFLLGLPIFAFIQVVGRVMFMGQYYTARELHEIADRRRKKIMSTPGRKAAEAQFAREHADWTDEQLLEYLKNKKGSIKKRLKSVDVIGCVYIMERLGAWCEIVERVNGILLEEKQARLNKAQNDTQDTQNT